MNHKEILDELRPSVRALREHISNVFEGYGALSGAVFVDGALDAFSADCRSERGRAMVVGVRT